jgi:putative ABC transport system permease protein
LNRQMIFASLISRPVRTLVSILAVALEVTLILVIVGLTTGMTNDSGKRIVGVGGDVILQAPNSSIILSFSSASMPVQIGEKIARDIPGVKAVTPVVIQTNSEGGLETVYGIDPNSFQAVGGPLVFLKGGLFKQPKDIVVDDVWANAKKSSVGDQVEVLGQKFRVAGIVEHGRGARIYLPLTDVQDMVGAPNKASIFFIKTTSQQDIDGVREQMAAMFPEYKITLARDLMSLMSSDKLPGLDAFIRTVVFIAVCVGVLVIFLSMYTTITERTREIGILRSLGASKAYVVRLILLESLLICTLGVGAGLIGSKLIAGGVRMVFPTLPIEFTAEWYVKASVFALLSGLIGSFYPSLKAAAQDPIEALAYE